MPRADGLQVGDVAPDFSVFDAEGRAITLRDFRDKAEVVLYFYPKDDSPGCTAQACSFRDRFEAFSDLGAEVIGVSSDSASDHRAFAARHRLPFRLITDGDRSLRRLYRVPKTLGLIPGRVTFLIDRQGVIRHVFSSQVRVKDHVAEALKSLQDLRRETPGPSAETPAP